MKNTTKRAAAAALIGGLALGLTPLTMGAAALPSSEHQAQQGASFFKASVKAQTPQKFANVEGAYPYLDKEEPGLAPIVSDVEIFEGRLYVGYGDYNANIGPLDLYSYDLKDGSAKKEIRIPTEAIDKLKIVNGSLYAPYTDPSVNGWDKPVGFAVNPAGEEGWKLDEQVVMTHIYDVASTDGKNLFLAGSTHDPADGKNYASVWYSPDGKTGWKQIDKTSSGGASERNYWMAAVGGKLFVQHSARPTDLRSWDGEKWSVEVAGGVQPLYGGDKMTGNVVQDRYIVSRSAYVSGTASIYDTKTKKTITGNYDQTRPSFVNDIYQAPDGTLYSFSTLTKVFHKSEDGLNWKKYAEIDSKFAPKNKQGNDVLMQHFAVDEETGTIYVGDNNAAIWTMKGEADPSAPTNPTEPTDPTEPTNPTDPTDPPVENKQKPVLTVGSTSTSLKWGQKAPNLLAGVSATDKEDGNLTSKVKVVGSLDTKKPGKQTVTYSVTDSDGNKVEAKRTYTIAENKAPSIKGLGNIVPAITTKGRSVNLTSGLTASDNEDGNLTSKMEVSGYPDGFKKRGIYTVKISVVDSGGKTATKTKVLIIL